MKSLKKFGYGMFVCKMQAAPGPVCSTFWLYSDAPAPGCMPEIAQLWRWNEFDFEFVPQTQATQNSYATLHGNFPTPYVKFYGSTLDWSAMTSGEITSQVVSWLKDRAMTDDIVMGDMQHYYNKWMVNSGNPATQIPATQQNFAGAVATTGPNNSIGGTATSGVNQPGWPNASVWKYPLTAVKPVPSKLDMSKMMALNMWRMPIGNCEIDVTVPGFPQETYRCIEKMSVLDGSTNSPSYTQAAMNNETYVFPTVSGIFEPGIEFPVYEKPIVFDPYSTLNTYTLVWTPTRVAFYLNADLDGTDVSKASPILEFDIADYPSLAQSGTQAPQGTMTWADTSFSDELGKVSINLANYVAFKAAADVANANLSPSTEAGAGWSGNPPLGNFTGIDALIRSVKHFPLISDQTNGSKTSDFTFTGDTVWGFDLGDGTWTAENFRTNISNYFGILYAQDFTSAGGASTDPLRDSKSPLAVNFDTNASGNLAGDKLPVMTLSCTPSTASPQRNFFRVGTTMNTGAPISETNPFMFVTLNNSSVTIPTSGASTPLAFFAPAVGMSVTATVNLYMSKTYHGSFPTANIPKTPDATATLTLSTDTKGNISWSVIEDTKGIITAYQSVNPHLITVDQGTATPGS
jgi:hypothetical protein